MKRDRGSALLVTLMVMVGLSLLGLGFVTISETENSISVNERNSAQVLSVAEAGARLVVEWFQDPEWAEARTLLPANTNAIKTNRVLTAAAPSPFTSYSGRYKADAAGSPVGRLFDKPFKPDAPDRFFGDAQRADVIINAATAPVFLNHINTRLFADRTNGEITEIRIYAPPIIGGTLNANGFWEGGQRYGLATIRVTAQKIVNSRVIAERVVKLVISEWPFPGPQGPVQSNANISTGGNFGVHWGNMTSEGTMEIKLPRVGMPWFDAWNVMTFERGYFVAGQDTFTNLNDNTDGPCRAENWLYKLYGQSLEDPWFEARAKGNIVNPISGTADHPFKITATTDDITATTAGGGYKGWSNWFQNQDGDAASTTCGARDTKLVLFPKIDYDFWKALAQSASTSTSGVKYLRWVADDVYTDGIETKKFAKWVNTVTGAKPGFYFFDTANGLNPQGAAAAGTLAPDFTLNSADDGPVFLAKGFIYLNTEEFGTTGINGPGGWYNFPGEPYRDIGYHRVDENTGLYEVDGAGNKIVADANNGRWDYQELNGNDRFDVFLRQRTETVPGGGTLTNQWFPVPWSPGCTPGVNGAVSDLTGCSEPHEPYLNLIYPTAACCAGGGDPNPVRVGWEDPNTANAVTRLRKQKDDAGNPIACGSGSDPAPPLDCTSNLYDEDGPLVENFGNQPNTKPIFDGVLYNEGRFDTQGNAAYFGSVLINGSIVGTGTPEVWFDEFLVKGGWQDKFKELPRVFITAHETEQ